MLSLTSNQSVIPKLPELESRRPIESELRKFVFKALLSSQTARALNQVGQLKLNKCHFHQQKCFVHLLCAYSLSLKFFASKAARKISVKFSAGQWPFNSFFWDGGTIFFFNQRYIEVKVGSYSLFIFSPPKIS